MDVIGMTNCCDPCIFLPLFNKQSSVSKEVNEKFRKAADDKKKSSTTLPHWGDIYCLGDLGAFHKAPRLMRVYISSQTSPFYSLAALPCLWMTPPN